MITAKLKDFSWERMIAAVDAVRERASRMAAALDRAGIRHAMIEGNAIAAWVARVDVAREKVRAEHLLPAPDVTESEAGPEFRVAALDALVRMKLTSFRLKDKVHLLDLADVGLIDETWCDRFPPALGARLRELLEAGDGEL